MSQSTIEYPESVVVDLTGEAPMRVLHVDDEAGFLKAAKPCLEMQGAFQVDTASSVEEAMEKMKKKAYDAIVCDYIMPRKDGLQFLKELRNSGNNIPFIIFTGKGREDVAIQALNLGADRYLSKIGGPATVYGELAHGIRQTVENKRADKALQRSEQRLAIRNEIAQIFLTVPDEEMYPEVLRVVLEAMKSKYGVFGYIDEDGAYVCPSMTRDIWDQCKMLDKTIVFPREKWSGIWGRALIEKKTLYSNEPFKVPKGHIPVTRALDVPIIHRGEVIGNFLVGNKMTDYRNEDWELLETIAGHIAPILSARLKGNRQERERRKIEEALRESEAKYRRLFEDSSDGLIIIDKENGNILDCNQEFMRQTGRNREQLLKMKIWDVRPPQLRDATRRKFFEVRSKGTGGSMELDFQKPSGEIVHIDFLSKATKIEGKEVLQSRCRDHTERKKAEVKLGESEKKFRNIFENANDAIIYGDLKGTILDLNQKAADLAGIEREKILGKNFSKLGLISLRDVPKLLGRLARKALGKAETEGFQLTITRKDGKKKFFEVNSTLIRKGKMPAGFLAIARDITGRRKTLEKLEMMNEKLGVVGKLTRHDVRNKLSAVTMNAYMAKQKLAGDHEALEHLSQIESAVGQVEEIFDFARNYEKLGVEELAYVDVEKSLSEAVMQFSDLHGAKIVNDCHGLTVLADSMLRQLFYNLIDNSLKHGEKVSRIRAYYIEAGKEKLRLVYEDDGVGIPKSEKKKVFMEGYGKGSGYGLNLIRKMCEVYGWAIHETGKHGKGAQFTLTIPKVGESGKANYQLR